MPETTPEEIVVPDPKTFSLFDHLEGRDFPTDSVSLYVDETSALEASKLIERRKDLRYPKTPEQEAELETVEAELKALAAKVEASAITVHLRGAPNGVVQDALEDDKDKGPGTYRLLALLIQKVTLPDGSEDSSLVSVDDMKRLEQLLPLQSWVRLNETASRLVVASLAYDEMADDGLFQKS